MKVSSKAVPVHVRVEFHPRCLVYVLDTSLAKFPPIALENDVMYLLVGRN